MRHSTTKFLGTTIAHFILDAKKVSKREKEENIAKEFQLRDTEACRHAISIPLGRPRQVYADRLFRLIQFVILAEGLPTGRDDLNQDSPSWNFRDAAYSGLIRLQIHFDVPVFGQLAFNDELHVDAGAVDGLLVISTRHYNRQTGGSRRRIGFALVIGVLVLPKNGEWEQQRHRGKNNKSIPQPIRSGSQSISSQN
jgi:hypothetical protein